jgi:uncharacterized repeat protein (TIGR03803 family)
MRPRVSSVVLTAVVFAALFFVLPGVASAQPDLQALHNFGPDGVTPHGPLFQANDLNLYGTTAGGVGTPATIFKMTRASIPANAGVVTVLHTFSAAGDGASPQGALIQGEDGYLYGTTSAGGAFGKGTVFRIALDGSGYAVLHSFAGAPSDGDTPLAGLLYTGYSTFAGTTYSGGASNAGAIFTISSGGSVTITHSFSGVEGAHPAAALFDPYIATNSPIGLVGTASDGGQFGLGTIFVMQGSNFYVLHHFAGGANDGANPQGTMATYRGIYGSTLHGGSSVGAGAGTIFKLDVSHNNAVSIVHAFTGGSDGATPVDAPTETRDQSLYGVTQRGGAADVGTLFRIVNDGADTFTTLQSFDPAVTGALPNGLTAIEPRANDQDLYATTQAGGPTSAGVAFAYTGRSKGAMLSPTPGTALGGTNVTFTWSDSFTALQYWLDIGTTPGGHDLWTGPTGGATCCWSFPVTGLSYAGGPVYVRLWTQQPETNWLYNDYTYTAYYGGAQMTSPSPGTVLNGSTVTFNWTTGLNATAYWLDVGTGVGKTDLFTQSTGTATSQSVTGLPVLGTPVYVRLWTQFANGGWYSHDYTYTATTSKAALTSPAPGSSLTAASATFTWTGAVAASQYWLDVGTSVGGGDLFDSSVGLALSQVVTGLPSTATPVYVRLWTQRNGSWLFNDYTYTSFDARATMTSPAPGAALSGASVTFQWSSAGSGASQYWLEVGRSAGAGDLFEASVGLATSQQVNALPVLGTPVYVRLWTLVGSTWLYHDYTYTALNARAAITSPAPGSALNASSVTFTWTPGTGALSYWLEVGTTPGSSNLFGQSVGLTTTTPVSGIPLTSGTIYVRLWTQLSGGWYYTDYTYTTVNAVAAMTSPTPGALLVTSNVTFTWNAVSGATEYWLEIGTAPNDANLFFTQSTGTSTSINAAVPMNGNPIYVRLWTLFGGVWRYADYNYQTIVSP